MEAAAAAAVECALILLPAELEHVPVRWTGFELVATEVTEFPGVERAECRKSIAPLALIPLVTFAAIV
tara:strand:+ start:306 stop:509 length:204 start_codon:yes stop_codon:yes gene_type:complete